MANGRSPEEARITLEQKNISYTPEEFVKNAFDIEVVKLFLESGMDVNVKNNEDVTALMRASREGELRLDVIKFLINKGADINARDNDGTALMDGTVVMGQEVVKLLLSKGADVNARNNAGGTALMLAVGRSDASDVVKLFLSAGADVNAKTNNGMTALKFAIKLGRSEVVELLRAAGAN